MPRLYARWAWKGERPSALANPGGGAGSFFQTLRGMGMGVRGQGLGVRVKGFIYGSNSLNTRLALWPPKPKELLIAVRILPRLGMYGV